jgi:hypothetical protein
MDFNWGEGNERIYGLAQFISTDTTNSSTTSFTNLMLPTDDSTNSASATGFDVTTGVLTSTANDSVYVINYDFRLDKDFNATADFQWVHKDSLGNIIDTINVTSIPYTAGSSSLIWSGNLTRVLQNNETLEAQFKTSVSAGLAQNSDNSFVIFTLNPLVITTNTLLQTLRGELGQWEFLKGIMTMFNLVASPDKSNPKNIIIEPYKDMFLPSIVIDSGTGLIEPNFFDDNSTQLDWTDKIDTTEIKLEVLADLNKRTVFKFVEDDDDYAFNLYKTVVQGHLYGSQVFDASTTTGNLQSVLEGEEEIIAEPFAATVPKPYDTQFSDFITPAIYSYNADDGTSEGFENSPRIMYNNGVKTLTSCTYYIPTQNGVSSENADAFLQFSHLTDIPTVVTNPPVSTDTVDFHFGICQLIQPIGDATPNNLFNTYWSPYFNELYNPDTRTMTLKVNLTPGDINTFNFYDTVFIKNRLFRVNKIDYKPNELATVEFILIP